MLSAIAYVGSLADTRPSAPQPSLIGALLQLGTSLRVRSISQADGIAADLIEAHGGCITDAVEREIGFRLSRR